MLTLRLSSGSRYYSTRIQEAADADLHLPVHKRSQISRIVSIPNVKVMRWDVQLLIPQTEELQLSQPDLQSAPPVRQDLHGNIQRRSDFRRGPPSLQLQQQTELSASVSVCHHHTRQCRDNSLWGVRRVSHSPAALSLFCRSERGCCRGLLQVSPKLSAASAVAWTEVWQHQLCCSLYYPWPSALMVIDGWAHLRWQIIPHGQRVWVP